jgi:predicted CXXCH cytochrome family protein
VSLSCSKQNDALGLTVKDNSGYQENQATYPHPVAWKNQHMDFMSKNKAEASCVQCHSKTLGAPLKVSCAMQCHHSDSEALPPKQTPIPVVNKCTTCHAAVTENKFAHYPANAGLCTTCHTVSDKHLNGQKDPVQTKTTAENCYTCHNRKDSETNIHPALQDDNSCITCHNPHGGKQRFFIQDFEKKDISIQGLCTQCHGPDVEMANKHGAVVNERSCLNCHNPHSSKNAKLLKLPTKDLCLSCHDKPIQATLSDSRIIPNIKEKVESSKKNMGSCTDCHSAHGSPFKRILIDNFSLENYNEYPAKAKAPNPYALCAQCHDVDSILNKDDTATTGFRSATKNLHWKHVVEETPGKSCRICHDPHGTKQEFFIKDSWKMNGHDINIKYTKTEKGGNCTFTCHDLRSYDREQ